MRIKFLKITFLWCWLRFRLDEQRTVRYSYINHICKVTEIWRKKDIEKLYTYIGTFCTLCKLFAFRFSGKNQEKSTVRSSSEHLLLANVVKVNFNVMSSRLALVLFIIWFSPFHAIYKSQFITLLSLLIKVDIMFIVCAEGKK